jgi:hypothetical protein
MAQYFGKQNSSRPILSTSFTSATTVVKAGAQTYQLRVTATAASWLSVSDSSSTAPSTGIGVPIAANTVGEYFTITPGQWYGAAGAAVITEMS